MSDTPGRRTAVLHSQDAGIPAAPGVVSSVYVVGAEGLASVKIGTSASPQQRVFQLQTGLPVALSILAVFPGGTRLERVGPATRGWPVRLPALELADDVGPATRGCSERRVRRGQGRAVSPATRGFSALLAFLGCKVQSVTDVVV
ncbi:GIY-YIG nuclease family protein (plasmid) [Streptomyces uncialis]|uniref:GIY-YIG nuclease family protein n=1 Tax=Streptomyces uncialis TaxID=1048205 RepID=UPI002E33AA05|nr:GIY-YIG nuclease family protein [Streptomyces uncialis]